MYMPRRLAQQTTFSDLEWPFHASRAPCVSWASCWYSRNRCHHFLYC